MGIPDESVTFSPLYNCFHGMGGKGMDVGGRRPTEIAAHH
jgi:hypothetical protein